jgi:hypothetical protein
LREALGEKLHAGVELVHPRRVRRFARDEHELLFAVGRLCGGGKRRESESERKEWEEGMLHGR